MRCNYLTKQRKLAEMTGFIEFCLSEGSFTTPVKTGSSRLTCISTVLAQNPSGSSF